MRVCAISRLKRVFLIGESLLYRLVQEPSSYVAPGLRYAGKYKLHSINGTYATQTRTIQNHANFNTCCLSLVCVW